MFQELYTPGPVTAAGWLGSQVFYILYFWHVPGRGVTMKYELRWPFVQMQTGGDGRHVYFTQVSCTWHKAQHKWSSTLCCAAPGVFME